MDNLVIFVFRLHRKKHKIIMSSSESNMEVDGEEEELLKVPESDISVDEGEEEELLKVDKETSKSKHA